MHLVGQGHLGRINMGNGKTLQRAVFTGHVHHAPIGEVGHGQAGNLVEGAGFVHQRGECGARIGEKPSRLLGTSAVIDVGRGAKHGNDPARLISNANGPSQEPAIVAMSVLKTVFGLERLATPQQAHSAFIDSLQVVWVNDRHPVSGTVGLFLGQPGIFEPAAIEVEKSVIGPGNPDDLGNRVGQAAETFFAFPDRPVSVVRVDSRKAEVVIEYRDSHRNLIQQARQHGCLLLGQDLQSTLFLDKSFLLILGTPSPGDFLLEMLLLFSSGRLARLGPQLGRSHGTAHQGDCQAEREVDAECQLGREAMDRQHPQWIESRGIDTRLSPNAKSEGPRPPNQAANTSAKKKVRRGN